MAPANDDPVAVWVAKLNHIARELDAICHMTYPTTWPEQTAALMARYKKLVKEGPKE